MLVKYYYLNTFFVQYNIKKMKQSQLVGRSIKEIPKDEESLNAQLLIRAGFIDKVTAGVYNYLPLGLKVLNNINQIIREEMNAIGGQEILLPVLAPASLWQTTGRWDSFDVLFKLKGSGNKDFTLNPTHEELVTPLIKKVVFSYKDLPVYVYQIQTKFRNEARAKSGLLRGREFLMKDLYSFHIDEEDLDKYYEEVKVAYRKILSRLEIGHLTYETYASGGAFSKYSHEYQTVSPHTGEDTIYTCKKCLVAVNKELIVEQPDCPKCGNKELTEEKSTEVGNIFKLKTRFSDSFQFTYTARDGKEKPVFMGCYGIGPSRIMGTLVEIFSDKNGIIWPKSVSPYDIHLLDLTTNKQGEKVYQKLSKSWSVLFDDRSESAGKKLKDSDLIGISLRLIVSNKLGNKFEIKLRKDEKSQIVNQDKLMNFLTKYFKK